MQQSHDDHKWPRVPAIDEDRAENIMLELWGLWIKIQQWSRLEAEADERIELAVRDDDLDKELAYRSGAYQVRWEGLRSTLKFIGKELRDSLVYAEVLCDKCDGELGVDGPYYLRETKYEHVCKSCAEDFFQRPEED